MASTFPIPLTTLAVGSTPFGPASVADADTHIEVTNDRTVTGGMNSQPSSTTLTYEIDQSNDGGTTWAGLASGMFPGGVYTLPAEKGGGTYNTDFIATALLPGTGRQLRAMVTVAGAAVAVQGSITTS